MTLSACAGEVQSAHITTVHAIHDCITKSVESGWTRYFSSSINALMQSTAFYVAYCNADARPPQALAAAGQAGRAAVARPAPAARGARPCCSGRAVHACGTAALVGVLPSDELMGMCARGPAAWLGHACVHVALQCTPCTPWAAACLFLVFAVRGCSALGHHAAAAWSIVPPYLNTCGFVVDADAWRWLPVTVHH